MNDGPDGMLERLRDLEAQAAKFQVQFKEMFESIVSIQTKLSFAAESPSMSISAEISSDPKSKKAKKVEND